MKKYREKIKKDEKKSKRGIVRKREKGTKDGTVEGTAFDEHGNYRRNEL